MRSRREGLEDESFDALDVGPGIIGGSFFADTQKISQYGTSVRGHGLGQVYEAVSQHQIHCSVTTLSAAHDFSEILEL